MHVRRADRPDDAAEMVAASAALAFDSEVPVAVLFSQRLIGAKVFTKPEPSPRTSGGTSEGAAPKVTP